MSDDTGQVDDRLRAQSAVQMIMEEHLGCPVQHVTSDHSPSIVNALIMSSRILGEAGIEQFSTTASTFSALSTEAMLW
ncbi:hypothetical protein GCM10011575_40670 [Microlunatus endophyticus]|uniref:Uncharacterized protein n=1 Tax=Microlunatus endophyticus TaxID=1716077 RepID=A0A917SG16_9ACTN|nr:hypothetical protein GCM10011575_40670 [Microlunatus endophyticus]